MDHNKGRLLTLSKLTGPMRTAHDGWLWVNLFDSVKETWQVLHVESPNLLSVTLIDPFHVSKDTWKVLEK